MTVSQLAVQQNSANKAIQLNLLMCPFIIYFILSRPFALSGNSIGIVCIRKLEHIYAERKNCCRSFAKIVRTAEFDVFAIYPHRQIWYGIRISWFPGSDKFTESTNVSYLNHWYVNFGESNSVCAEFHRQFFAVRKSVCMCVCASKRKQ